MTMNIIVDYGVGNLESLKRACEEIDFPVIVSNQIKQIKQATAIILPGVGAYEAAMKELDKLHLIETLLTRANDGVPILGICLGMQLLYEFSEENGGYKGLGLLKGNVKQIPEDVKVPHMGWNKLIFTGEKNGLNNVNEGEYVYFVHSYYVDSLNDEVVAYSNYGVNVPAIVKKGTILGMQFHPEKSGETGLNLLKVFKEMCEYETISSN